MSSIHTLSVHSGTFTDSHGAVMPPIYATSTLLSQRRGSIPVMNIPQRESHPSRAGDGDRRPGKRHARLRVRLRLAAISTVLELLDKDSHLVAVDDVWRHLPPAGKRSPP